MWCSDGFKFFRMPVWREKLIQKFWFASMKILTFELRSMYLLLEEFFELVNNFIEASKSLNFWQPSAHIKKVLIFVLQKRMTISWHNPFKHLHSEIPVRAVAGILPSVSEVQFGRTNTTLVQSTEFTTATTSGTGTAVASNGCRTVSRQVCSTEPIQQV
jgi:hypothetical protein